MNHKKAKRKADDVRRKDMKHMSEDAPDSNAVKRFRRPVAYQAGKMVQEQGRQIEHKTVPEYLAEKYDIKGGELSGQSEAEKVQME